jgi:hypothetical protein
MLRIKYYLKFYALLSSRIWTIPSENINAVSDLEKVRRIWYLPKGSFWKKREYNITYHRLLINFKAVFDSIDRTKLLDAMAEFNFPDKLIHISKMILACTLWAAKIDGNIFKNFRILHGLIKGDLM